ncbi:imidazole glycerol phosphate synthase subunit HisH [Larkinella soli]|uniref:imidazole glycerol phosphate synthase subunit HisH n=1 Tax=Larkinella soli TaxID=1770527 RepID=UPI000FFB7357|nr:imidazole glycerol phosphate synthase subunit HisH [Larkinella soli]
MNIVVIDYGMGNLRSVHNKFRKLGVECGISADPAEIEAADALILPGVGHYGRAMDRLRSLDLLSLLNRRVLEERVPVMGVCLGMQLLMEHSEEGDAEGLGWIKGNTVRFRLDDQPRLKIPHIGWNSIEQVRPHPICEGLAPDELFYFVHSFHVSLTDPADALHRTRYGYDFVSAVQRDNIFGFQYHPEKSQDAGIQVFRNFIHLVKKTAYVPTESNTLPSVTE